MLELKCDKVQIDVSAFADRPKAAMIRAYLVFHQQLQERFTPESTVTVVLSAKVLAAIMDAIPGELCEAFKKTRAECEARAAQRQEKK